MAFNIFSTLNQNLQNFGGDAYDAYQAGKSKVGNVASTINNNLQDFGGDIYDVGSTIKKNVSNFGTQTYNQGKNVASTIQKNVGDYYEKGLKPIPGQAYDATIGRASKGFTDYAKGVIDYGREREASNVGIDDAKALKVMQAMKDEGYSKDEILAQMSQFDMQEKARKQQEYAQKQTSIRENASTGRKLLSGAVDFVGGAEAGMMRLPAGVTDFVTGGTDYTKDTLKGINDFTSRSGAAKVGDIAGQIAGTALIPGVGRIAPSGAGMGATIGRGAVYGGAFGGLTPIMEKGSEATGSDIAGSAIQGAAMGAVAGPLLEKGIPALVKGTQSGIKAGQYAQGSIAEKLGAGTQAFGKSIGRQTMQGTKEAIKAPIQLKDKAIQSLLSSRSDKTKNIIAQTYGIENQEIGALRNLGEKSVSDTMKRMQAIDETALTGGGVNSIYDDLHKEIMTGVGKRSKEISALEAQKNKILQSSPVVVKQSELESIFDDVLKAQGIQRTQETTKKGIKNVYNVVGEGNITSSDMANIEKLYNEVFRTKGDVSALNMNTRIKNLQGNLYNSDGAAVYGSNSMTSTAKSIVAKVNDLLKKKLPPEYGMAKEAQSKIFDKRNQILKYLKEEDNALALLSDDAIANMSEEAVTKLINDSIAGNKMALFLRRLANSTTTGGDAKQLANIIKEFTGVDAESKAIALRAIAKLTGNQQILNELGGLLDKGVVKGALGLVRKILAPSPDKVIKAVATKPPIVQKAKPKATKPPVSKAKPRATTESALKTTPVVPEKKSIVAKKEIVSTIPITDVKKEPKFIRNGGLTDDNGIYKDHRYKNEVYKKEFIANSDIEGTVIKKGDRVAISEESGSKGKRYVAILQKGVKDENGFYITSEPNIKLSNFYKDSSTPKESPFKNNKGFINPSEIKKSLLPKKGADEARQFYDDLVYAGNSPIVAQRETAKRFGTIRAMSASKAGTMDISKAPDALIQEARKYKSADEFIKAQGEPVYHGTTKANYDSINTNGFDISKNTKGYAEDPHAIFLSKYSDNGSDHSAGTYGSHIVEAYINPNAKILDLDSNMGYDLIGRISPKVMKEEGMKTKYDYVIKKGYDAIDYGDGEIAVFNPSLIKTQSQLKQIYEQANKTKVVPKVVESKAGTMELPEALVQEAKKYKSADEFIDGVKKQSANLDSPSNIGGAKLPEVYEKNVGKPNTPPKSDDDFLSDDFTLYRINEKDSKILEEHPYFGGDSKALTNKDKEIFLYVKPGKDFNKLSAGTKYDLYSKGGYITENGGKTWVKIQALDDVDWFGVHRLSESQLKQIYEQANKNQ